MTRVLVGNAGRQLRTLVTVGTAAWLAAACGGGSPAGPEPVPTYGPCDQQPNYVVAVGLNRWREFPLAYFFDDAAFTAEFRDVYREAITEGIRRWHDATANELGAVVEVGAPEEADFVITFRGVTPTGLAARTFHATGTPFLAGGEIAFNSTTLVEVEEDVRNGVTSRRGFRNGLAAIAAHEMGHLLGIIGHPNRDDSIMGDITNDFPTTADVHTLVHAYCR